MRPSYLYNGNPYTGKTSLYWDGLRLSRNVFSSIYFITYMFPQSAPFLHRGPILLVWVPILYDPWQCGSDKPTYFMLLSWYDLCGRLVWTWYIEK